MVGAGGLGILLALGGAGFMIPPMRYAIEYTFSSLYPNRIPDPSDLILQRHRGLLNEDEYRLYMQWHGFPKEHADNIFETSKQLLSARDLIVLKWRGEISDDVFVESMAKLGIEEDTARQIETVARFYPGPSDFIRFAVREVFDTAAIDKYQMDAEFPEKILPKAAGAGIDEEKLRWYWRAHWELPGVTQVLQMVNMLQPAVLDTVLPDGSKYGDKYRDFDINPDDIRTTYKDLSEYLKMVDISPYWRDRLKALTFPPITRVDLRRLYALGIIEEEELRARLLELGYSLRDAERMIQFYKTYRMSDERDLTLTQIKTAYNYREINFDTAAAYLQDMGYDRDEAELILAIEDAKKEQKRVNDRINAISNLFRKGVISQEEALMRLDALNLNSEYRDDIIEEIMLDRLGATRLPTKTDLEKFLKAGVITEEEYIERMTRLGYREEDAKLYLKLMKTPA